MIKNLKIVYFGTPDFAVAGLKTLIDNNYNIAAVVTAPDKPAGRGKKLKSSAIKEFAQKHNLKILQPNNLKSPGFIEELRNLNANLQVIVAFRMLPEIVWAMPKYGTFNLHASLLPQYRGAAPINWAIINGEKETGVTSFFLKQKIDTGNIILQKKTDIKETDNAGTLHDKLMILGAEVILETVKLIEQEKVNPIPQDKIISGKLKTAPKIFKNDTIINWDKKALEIHNLVRGLSPYPAALTKLNGKTLKIYETSLTNTPQLEDKTNG
jgi:methionyl-tRNA formyltransferase